MYALIIFLKNPLYVDVNISIRSLWLNMFNLSKQREDNNFHDNMDFNTTSLYQKNNFEEIFNDVIIDNLIQNFLTSNQSDDEILTMAPTQD